MEPNLDNDTQPDDLDLPEPFDDDDDDVDDEVNAGDEDPATAARDKHAFDAGIVDDAASMSAQPSDYSYFDPKIVKAWSGTENLRLGKCSNSQRL
jgi:hypothetical protein